tara:strand:+ start:1120 stop:1593 length:474 start_codon:yes stop_codon:yes gene_type:complete
MKKLSKKIITLLIKKKLKLAVAESCTGGLLSNIITSISGSSKVFSMGLVTYSNQSKFKLLKVPKNTITNFGAVSTKCCLSMLNGLNKLSNSDITVSITGIAGPKGGTRKKPVGLVYIGIKRGKKTYIKEYFFKNKGRAKVQKSAVNKSLQLILSILK